MKDDDDSQSFVDLNKDISPYIEIDFVINDVRVCEIRAYKSFAAAHYDWQNGCGTPGKYEIRAVHYIRFVMHDDFLNNQKLSCFHFILFHYNF